MLKRENIIYGSVCSGIEAATMAWHGLGWEAAWFAEIEAFPSAVLAHHYLSVPNLGDMTKIRDMVAIGEVSAPDILVGGTPCQAFSVAGARQSLDDERGQLTLEYVRLANEIDSVRHASGQQSCVIVWENVPGVLNTKDNAFGCFLGALSGAECELQPSGKKWTNAGCVYGPQRAVAWRILDAQYFGLAQRRKRIFVVASARKGFNPDKILFEFEGVRRDSPPSRETGQDFTADVAENPYLASGVAIVKSSAVDVRNGTVNIEGPTMTLQSGGIGEGRGMCINAIPHVYCGTQDPTIQDNQAFPLGRNQGQENVALFDAYQHHGWREGDTCGTLTVGQNNTVRGDTPLVCQAQTFGIPGNWIGRKPENGGNATEPMDNIAPCQTKTDRHAVAYGFEPGITKREGNPNRFNENICPTLRAAMGDNQAACVYENKQADECYPINTMTVQGRPSDDLKPRMGMGIGALNDPQNTLTKAHCHGVATQYGVRRLTPTECERLQGFPDSFTQIPYRNKSAADCPDGPRYAALGNSMAVPVMAWIGSRIEDAINAKT